MKAKLSQDTIDQVIQLYKEGKQRQEIAAICNIHKNSIGRLLRQNGIERTRVKRVSQENIAYMIKQYTDGISSEIIAGNLNITGGAVCRILKKNGVEIRPSIENKRRYKINESYFQTINTEENAYFLGLLYADGNLGSSSNGVSLILQVADKHMLEAFSTAIYGFVKLEDNTRKGDGRYLGVNIYSQKMHTDLIKLGCTPKKSFTITFPTIDIVPDHLMHHFIRGFMDGDGCICITDENKPRVDFTSALPFLEGLVAYLKLKLGLEITRFGGRNPDRDTNTRNIQIGGFPNVRLLLDFLYKDATIFLNRKKEKYDEIPKQQAKKNSRKMAKSTNAKLYGTTYIPEYNGNQITEKYLQSLSSEDKRPIIDMLYKFYRDNGFPYTQLSNDQIIKDFLSLKNCDCSKVIKDNQILFTNNQTGIQIFKHFAPHFFDAYSAVDKKPSIIKAFHDDALLKKVVENRITRNYNITGNMIKQGLVASRIAFKPSIFNCCVAKYIYSQYTKEDSIIYDYSMGFGQRLLGALSLPYRTTYVGVDPFNKMVKSNQDIYDFYNANIPMFNRNVDLRCVGSEDFCDQKYVEKVDVAFSSPPYYNLEVYCDEKSQAYSSSYVDFLNSYWRKTVANISSLLSENGRFIINIIDKVDGFEIGNDMCNVVREAGFEVEHEYKIQLSRNLEFGGKKDEHKYEPIYVFKRIG
jgi:hypothetical protein